jgi:hypothetical protein
MMDIETCIKYLNFVSNECSKHLKDKEVTDDELTSLIVELQRFKDTCVYSQLPQEVKTKVSAIRIDITLKEAGRGTWYALVDRFTFGIFTRFNSSRQPSQRRKILDDIRYDTASLASFTRLHYSRGI